MYICEQCSKKFDRTQGEVNRGRTHFCSLECSRKSSHEKAIRTADKIIRANKKQCKLCNKTRMLKYFPKSKFTHSGYYSYCYDCKRGINRQQDIKRYDKRKADSRRAYLWRTYGITLEDYNSMLFKQNGLCAICYQESVNKLHAVDHDHSSGAVRGLLCHNCNRGLGMFKDNTDFLQSAIMYLK